MSAVPSPGDAVRQVLTGAPLLDAHNDLPWELREQAGYDLARMDPASRLTTTHTDLPRLAEGGVGGQFWSVFVPQSLRGAAAVTATLEQVDVVRRMCARYADRMVLATSADQVEAAWVEGRFASLMGAEGGHSIDCSLGVLRMLHALGVRYLTLTHNENVPWADSATDVRRLGGLSAFGREVVAEMNRLGMLVDCSHVSAETMRDAVAASQAPPFFSHSSAHAVCPHPRNVPDDVLAETGRRGGVCMVTFVPKFVSNAVREWDQECLAEARQVGVDHRDHIGYAAFQATWARSRPQPGSSIEDVVAHIEHVREVAGPASVGIGGDYDGVSRQPSGLEDVTGYPLLLEALHARGWSRSDLAALTSGNILRVMRDTEAVARAESRRRGPSTATIAALDPPLPATP